MSRNILIIGTKPPPVGGVTIHVDRLIKHLRKNDNFNFIFLNVKIKNLLFLPFILRKYDLTHLHTSNHIVQLYFSVITRLFSVKSIITYHGDLKRYGNHLNLALIKLSIKISKVPIVLNEGSFQVAKRWNSKTRLIGAFIQPSLEDEHLDFKIKNKISQFSEKFKLVFCTNAYKLTYNIHNEEIYGIEEIVNTFQKFQEYAVIISDPSGNYKNYFEKNNICLEPNILLISEIHSFVGVLQMCDGSIRNTITDGDSLSVKESLFYNKLTICTDVVDRPNSCFLFKRGSLAKVLQNLPNIDVHNYRFNSIKCATDDLFDLYNTY